jgi:TIR domain
MAPVFATFDDLRGVAEKADKTAVLKSATASLTGKNLFLSYSSKDQEFLTGVISVLTNHGAKIYIDQEDAGLPEQVSVQTATRLHDAIASCPRFVVFVTTNSKDSRWDPWELGLGTGLKSKDHVAIFPCAEKFTEKAWAEQEYLGLYQRIVWGKTNQDNRERWLVHDIHRNTADELAHWLKV